MQVTTPAPYPAQIPVLRACFDNSSTYITLCGGRQVGKTFLCNIVSLKWALDNSNQCIMVVSPTDSQVKKLFKQTIQMIVPIMSSVKNYKSQSGDSEIVFVNGSQILFRSALSENTLRGYSNTHLILDECAFIKEETWSTILAPTLTVRGKKVLFASTPKGNNFLARLYAKGLGEDKAYKSFKLTYHDNPFCNEKFIEEQRLTLPDEIFQQEYLCQFIDAAGCFRNISDNATLRLATYNPSDQYYIGVDIAFKNDYTVAICFNQRQEMVDMLRFNNTEIVSLTTNLKQFFNKWKAKKILIESNNQGLPVIQTLRAQGINNISEFETSKSSKPIIINNLIAALGKKEVKLINDSILVGEFNAFTATISNTGSIKYAAAYGHDDIVMATAIAYECVAKTKYSRAWV